MGSTPRLQKLIAVALVYWVEADPTLKAEVQTYLGGLPHGEEFLVSKRGQGDGRMTPMNMRDEDTPPPVESDAIALLKQYRDELKSGNWREETGWTDPEAEAIALRITAAIDAIKGNEVDFRAFLKSKFDHGEEVDKAGE